MAQVRDEGLSRPGDIDVRGDYQGDDPCSLANVLAFVGERWAFFVLREALAGTTRFGDFHRTLGISTDVLTVRLTRLVDAGVLTRRSYREKGQRARDAYHLTDVGRELGMVVAALQQWGDAHAPSRAPATIEHRTEEGVPVRVGFIDQEGRSVPWEQVRVHRTAAHPMETSTGRHPPSHPAKGTVARD